jgi:hypothetical protein
MSLEKDFVPYQESLELKELRFDEPCLAYYDICDGYAKGYSFCYSNVGSQDLELGCLAPTFSQAFRWFREKHNIDGLLHKTAEGSYYFWITECEYENYNHYKYHNQIVYFKTYEEAELACLTKLIDIVKEKQ